MTELPLIPPGNSPDPLVHDQNYRLLREKFNGGIDLTDIDTSNFELPHDNIADDIPPTKLEGAYARSSVSVTNTTGETVFAQSEGGIASRDLRIRTVGVYINSTGLSRTVTFRVRYGGAPVPSVMWGDVSGAIASSAVFRPFFVDAQIHLDTAGQLLAGEIVIGPAAVGSVTGVGDGSAAVARWEFVATSLETTAETLFCQVTAQHSAASANLTLLAHSTIELI